MDTIIVTLTLSLLVTPAQEPVAPSAVECTFEHARYAGTCVERVTPEEKQTHLQACQAVLGCLNDTRCVKTYCNATTLRGGWKLVSPKPEAASARVATGAERPVPVRRASATHRD